jgi:hypothetical protein
LLVRSCFAILGARADAGGADRQRGEGGGEVDPVALIDRGWESVKQRADIQGSCTVCVLTLDRGSSTLRAANLGDSGFMCAAPARPALLAARRRNFTRRITPPAAG